MAGYGSIMSMILIIALTVLACLGYAMMRIGGRDEHLGEVEPRID